MTHSTLRKDRLRRTRKTMIRNAQDGPRESSIQLILGYSRALQVVDAPPVGHIEVVLN